MARLDVAGKKKPAAVRKADFRPLKNLSATENKRNQLVIIGKDVFKKGQHFKK
ncbi:hypothetical protein NE852_16610 [Rhizobium sp. Pop5]|uniref:hypothetical protein n=1 Tax=Rhizobium sp. Pop5 TaxID=1223565 RepID=UPI0013E2CB44|nr:hypothetical protein [Rhizobium sp. Pop5]UVD55704.1 hypothetical protein NE852_16610 [Rhizobium sp. Pop5]